MVKSIITSLTDMPILVSAHRYQVRTVRWLSYSIEIESRDSIMTVNSQHAPLSLNIG